MKRIVLGIMLLAFSASFQGSAQQPVWHPNPKFVAAKKDKVEMQKCNGTKKDGTRCRIKVRKEDGMYCRFHSDQKNSE